MTKLLVGMIHLPPLPGAPGSRETLGAIEDRALEEARALLDAGFEAAMVENFGDAPFFKERVEAVTVASMTRIAAAIRRELPALTLGVNVLRNDALSALSVAAAVEAAFIRVNVHVGATATDQGIVEGRAAETLRARRSLGASDAVAIWADVHVKHGKSLAHASITDEAEDAVERGCADALIVSGRATGVTASPDELRRVKALELGVPVLVGSGITEDNAKSYLEVADGVIVGTSLKQGGRTTSPIDPERARRFVERARGA
jgi:uncharacterized protein